MKWENRTRMQKTISFSNPRNSAGTITGDGVISGWHSMEIRVLFSLEGEESRDVENMLSFFIVIWLFVFKVCLLMRIQNLRARQLIWPETVVDKAPASPWGGLFSWWVPVQEKCVCVVGGAEETLTPYGNVSPSTEVVSKRKWNKVRLQMMHWNANLLSLPGSRGRNNNCTSPGSKNRKLKTK